VKNASEPCFNSFGCQKTFLTPGAAAFRTARVLCLVCAGTALAPVPTSNASAATRSSQRVIDNPPDK
jgi:hypothetical protein